jgi:hypothetical protein
MKPTEFIIETSQIAQEADNMHADHEVQMARSDCYSAAKYAIELHRMLKEVSEQQGLDGWVSEKITLANDYLRSVHEYLSHEMAHGQEQAMMGFTAEAAEYAVDQLLVEDDYDDAVADFLSKNKPTVGKTHKPRKSERLGGSRHIGGGGEKMKASRTGISSKPTGKAVAGQASLGEDGQKTMSRAAKGYEKYGKEGMQALAKAGREGKDLDKIRNKYNKYDKDVTEVAMSPAPAPQKSGIPSTATTTVPGMRATPDDIKKANSSAVIGEMATGGGSSSGSIATSMGGPGHKPTSGVPKKIGNAHKSKKVAVGKGVY